MAKLGVGVLIIPQKPWEVHIQDLKNYEQIFRDTHGYNPPKPIITSPRSQPYRHFKQPEGHFAPEDLMAGETFGRHLMSPRRRLPKSPGSIEHPSAISYDQAALDKAGRWMA